MEITNPSHAELLDKILALFREQPPKPNNWDALSVVLAVGMTAESLKIPGDETQALYEILRQDGYVIEAPKIGYKITPLGVIFISNGGYVKRTELNEAESLRISTLEKNSYRVSVWVAIGAIGLLVFEVVKFVIDRMDMIFCNCH